MHQHHQQSTGPRRRRFTHLAGAAFAAPAFFCALATAQTPAPTTVPTEDEPIEMLQVFVSGKGESRATNAIAPADLELSIPGIGAEKLLAKMPGINVVTNDPFGFYEFGNDIRIRAFALDKLAVSLDGVPMGNNDARYGTPIGRMVDSENLTTIKVSQGAGDVTTPAYQALGGSLQFFTKDPSLQPGAVISATYGDFAQKRMFAKFETGEIFPGLTAYVSASHFEFEPRGLEGIAQGMGRRMEAKIKYATEKATFRYTFTYNDRDDFDTLAIGYGNYRDLYAGDYLGTGRGFEKITPFNEPGLGGFDYGDFSDEGRHIGPPVWIDPATPEGEGVNAQYYDQWRNGRMDYFHRMVADFDLSPSIKVKVTPYYQDKQNYGTFGVPKSVAEGQIRAAYAGDPSRTDIWAKMRYNSTGQPVDENGNVVTAFSADHAIVAPSAVTSTTYVPGVPGRAARDEDFGGHRFGLSGNLEWTTDKNVLVVGAWYEFDHHGAYRPTYNLVGGAVNGDFAYDQPLFLNYSRYFDTDVYQAWVQDTVKLMDGKLDLIFGVKALELERSVEGFLNLEAWSLNQIVQRDVSYDDYFLPQVGLLYRLSDTTEIFFNYSENMATPNAGILSSPGSFIAGLLSPEYSDNFDIGVRGEIGPGINYTLQAYYIKYTDRILAVPIAPSAGVGVAGQEAYQNVGGVDSLGAELALDWKTPIKGLQLTGSLALQETTFQEDLINGVSSTGQPSFFAIADKDLGNTPLLTANIDARYTVGGFRFNFGGRFYDSVYVNHLNTQELPSYTVFEAAIAYSGAKGSALENYTIAVNAYNVFDQYFWTAASYTSDSGEVQADQGRQISLTISAKF